jgi:hypothetical protein
MAAAATDLLQEVGINTATTLDAPGYTISDTSITVASTANMPTATGITFAIDTVDANGDQVAGSYNEYVGTVASATSITNVSHQNGTDQNYSAGTTTRVYLPVSAERENRIVEWGLVEHSQAGVHALTSSSTLTSSKFITGLNDTNGNELMKVTATASAVNEVTLANAATGNAPTLTASGGDTNVSWKSAGKGTGKAYNDSITEYAFDFVVSGLVWSGDSYASTLNASMTAGYAYISGTRVTIAAVTARAFTASKDTYIDLGSDGTLDYNEVANNAPSPALAADHIRIGIIVTGAGNIAAAGSVNQGQEDKILPIASSIPYAVTDSLGNLICPRDPARKVLGYRQRASSNFSTSSATPVQVTELSCPVMVPTGRKVRVSFICSVSNNTAGGFATDTAVWDGAVGGTRLSNATFHSGGANFVGKGDVIAVTTPTSASKTYNASVCAPIGNTSAVSSAATQPAFIMVELV